MANVYNANHSKHKISNYPSETCFIAVPVMVHHRQSPSPAISTVVLFEKYYSLVVSVPLLYSLAMRVHGHVLLSVQLGYFGSVDERRPLIYPFSCASGYPKHRDSKLW